MAERFKTLEEKVLFYAYQLPIELRLTFVEIIEKIEKGWGTFNPKTKRYHWNYKGGITPENKSIRSSAAMGLWRVKVFERDNYTCRECNQVGGDLNAHHVKEFAKYPELRFEVENGLTLCKGCHISIHKNLINA